MGKQQRLKEERAAAQRRSAALQNARVPFPEDLRGHPAANAVIAIFTEGAGRFIEPMAENVTPHGLRGGVRAALTYLDELLSSFPTSASSPTGERANIACRPACNYCCTLRVSTSAPTVLALAYYLRKKLDPSQMAALLARLEAHLTQGQGMTPQEQAFTRRMCPLNVEGFCIGYEYRPYSCRSYHSFDVEACRMAAEVDNTLSVAQVPQRTETRALVERAASACTRALRLNDDELELVPALLIALTEPNPEERYIAGENIFAPAHRPEVPAAIAERYSKPNLMSRQ